MKRIIAYLFILALMQSGPDPVTGQQLATSEPEEMGMDPDVLSRTEAIIQKAIDEGQTPGAVLTVVRKDRIVWNRAYGSRDDTGTPADSRTIYDLASLTKPIATATALLQLVEQGQLRLNDPVSNYLPDFRNWQEDNDQDERSIRIIHLLTHTSGMPAYPPVKELGNETAPSVREVLHRWLDTVDRQFAPGMSFQYSCPNFVTLQRIVEQVSGLSLDRYAEKHIFQPLGMNDTGYTPPPEKEVRTAPTGFLDNGQLLLCRVHDPFARELMDGISGNAGLFSTAEDLAIFSGMMLNDGEWRGVRILSPASIKRMTSVPDGLENFGRGLGWDLNSAYASNQGDLFGPATYGHTGYTGTSLIIDPDREVAVILLTNRVHPEESGSVVALRSKIANIVAASIRD